METPILCKLGETIRILRCEREWSQEELANRCGLHRTYVGSIERGERNVSAVNLERIAKALNVRIGVLFRATDEEAD